MIVSITAKRNIKTITTNEDIEIFILKFLNIKKPFLLKNGFTV